jgi:hypothetical protein
MRSACFASPQIATLHSKPAAGRKKGTGTEKGDGGLFEGNDAEVGEGNVVNEVQFVYNDFGQNVTDYPAHGGAVNTSTSPKVEYANADGSENAITTDTNA